MFATSSRNDVRVWHAVTGKELLRIKVANLQCNAVEITPDARAIITGHYMHSLRLSHLTFMQSSTFIRISDLTFDVSIGQ